VLVRRSIAGQRLLYRSLGIGFVVGLAAQVGGYLLKSSVTTELFGLVADLLYALGWALWTGVVVVVFVEVVPEAKRRQYKQALDAHHPAVATQPGGGLHPTAGDRDGDLLRCSSCRQLRLPISWGEVAAGEQPPRRRDPDHEDGQQDRQRAQRDGAADQGVRWGVVVEGAEVAEKGDGRPGLGDEVDGKADRAESDGRADHLAPMSAGGGHRQHRTGDAQRQAQAEDPGGGHAGK
jgi:hypothetical protein